MILKYPSLLSQFKDAVLTDLPLDQMSSAALCFRGFNSDNLTTQEVPAELLFQVMSSRISLNAYSFVYRWDNRLVEWISTALKN